jgi:hypothetical protein
MASLELPTGGTSIFIWNAGCGKRVDKLQGQTGPECALAWAAHGDRLAWGDHTGGLMLTDRFC